MSSFEIRRATPEEFALAIEWAAAEGWNPGRTDLRAFHAADPEGFLMGYVDGVPAASLSVVRYGADYGFLGFYIVRPEYRGQGFGIRIWNAGLQHLEGRTIGLDGVVAQQANYRKSGFELAGRNIRFTGTAAPAGAPASSTVQAISRADLDEIATYDHSFFPADRHSFMADWVCSQTEDGRLGLIARKGSATAGFGVIRECRSGYKIGPLFADDTGVAGDLFACLCQSMEPGRAVSIDVPEDNPSGVELARQAGLEPSFETARMYKGPAPSLPVSRTFGITTFELG